jgi:hypothetical protein
MKKDSDRLSAIADMKSMGEALAHSFSVHYIILSKYMIIN